MFAENIYGHLLTQRLQAAVGLAVHFLDGGVVELHEFVALIDAGLGEVRIGRDARDQHVLLYMILEQFGREYHLLRGVRGVVDDGIPVTPFQRVDLPVAIPDQLFDAGVGLGIALAAIEQRQRVAAGLEYIHEVRADETGATQDEHLEWLGPGKNGIRESG